MHIKFVLVFAWVLFATDVSAQSPMHILFAVDLSSNTADKELAFDVIKEVTVSAPKSAQIGLTLFDDTVRFYVPPNFLNAPHIQALNQAMFEPPPSVHGTSNLAVGIERAIDRFAPDSSAILVVFTRGVIDTETQDPRARFTEWLEHILLPQATLASTAISLVIPDGEIASRQIKDVFAASNLHHIIVSEAGKTLNAELASTLGIQNRVYGNAPKSITVVAEILPTPLEPALYPAKPDYIESLLSDKTLIIRLVLLALASTALLVVVFWYFRAKPKPRNIEQTDHSSSSTYLPLTEKPGRSRSQRTSTSSPSQAGQPRTIPTAPRSPTKQSVSKDPALTVLEPDPWE
jgi:hypothetical protein